MDPLPLTITDAGIDLIVAAESGGLDAIVIAEIGLSATPFVAAADLTALPDEIKRVATISGAAVDAGTLHLTMRDSTTDTYEFTGFGVFLADGTLFATYSQAEEEGPIAAKAEVSMLYLAFDLKLEAEVAELFTFGDANFLNPPATAETAGVAQLATLEEVQAGDGDDTIVSPAILKAVYVALAQLGVANGVATLGADGKLALAQRPPIDPIDFWFPESEAAMLALEASVGDWAIRGDTDPTEIYVLQEEPASDLANWLSLNIPAPVSSVNGKVGVVVLDAADVGAVPTARTITGTGLASGGGDLGANREIMVPKASRAETSAGEIDTKAVTPYGLAGALADIGAGVPAGRKINGGGLVSGGGDLSADRTLTVSIASAAEALAGAINTKALTPASLASILDAIAAKVPSTRTISTSGLASGGGALSANRSIDVPAASVAEVLAATIGTKAVTPASLAGLISVSGSGSTMVIKIGSAIFQIFAGTANANGTTTLALPENFPSACVAAFANGGLYNAAASDNGPYVYSKTASSVTLFNASDAVPVQILAIGK
ncbi:hypothetical protein [Erythrobacter sp. SG61-1L]|uniref:hypothetical protein n=1 Tax=Erythrobacter sp. SG61-1L TaxID=1603897 RepID=UPI0006C90F0C|nr:hypothetical protein [Erythrobacter sp. SG61-1L]